MKITPLGTRILIKIIEVENKTASGIYIPDTAKDKTCKGSVIENGEIRTVAVNDIVIYDKYAGTNIKVNGEDHLLVDIKDVIAIVEG